jgi:hypothetical protein
MILRSGSLNLSFEKNKFFHFSLEITFSPPSWDPIGGGMVMSLATKVRGQDQIVLGVTGVDVHLAEFLEDFIYYDEEGGASRPILIEVSLLISLDIA